MAHNNRYYIINAEDPNISEIEDVIVGQPDTQRYSIDNTKIVVKLHQNDHSDYIFLEPYNEENHSQALIIMGTPEWIHPIDI